jgi:prepilin-type N-terminal cleavage/methylation domain-containing protein
MNTRERIRGNAGFTLVEVVVVIAVVALLAAILAPLIAKNIDDAKEARAENEAQVIAAALANFYKDVGRWPTMDASGSYNGVTQLASGNAADPGTTVASNGWDSDTSGAGIDYLENHLYNNTPKGAATYPTTGRRAWRGPYLNGVPLDPWGTPYMVNIEATDTTGAVEKGFVISAGPNGVMDTTEAAVRATTPGGDDIAVSFYVR